MFLKMQNLLMHESRLQTKDCGCENGQRIPCKSWFRIRNVAYELNFDEKLRKYNY